MMTLFNKHLNLYQTNRFLKYCKMSKSRIWFAVAGCLWGARGYFIVYLIWSYIAKPIYSSSLKKLHAYLSIIIWQCNKVLKFSNSLALPVVMAALWADSHINIRLVITSKLVELMSNFGWVYLFGKNVISAPYISLISFVEMLNKYGRFLQLELLCLGIVPLADVLRWTIREILCLFHLFIQVIAEACSCLMHLVLFQQYNLQEYMYQRQ